MQTTDIRRFLSVIVMPVIAALLLAQSSEGLDIALDAHYVRTAAEYEDYAGLITQDVGTEPDLTLTTSRISGSLFVAGFSLPADRVVRRLYRSRPRAVGLQHLCGELLNEVESVHMYKTSNCQPGRGDS